MRFLIVEDQPMVATLLERYLRPIADDIKVAYTWAQATDFLKDSANLDIVTLDLNLPDSNTQRTLGQIKNMRTNNPDLLVIVISGAMSLSDAEEVFTAGADGFMPKDNVSLSSNNMLVNLREVVLAVVQNPRRYQQNINFLERVVDRISTQLRLQTLVNEKSNETPNP